MSELKATPQYSIVIPAYNEAERLGATLDKILEYVQARELSVEIVVANDGSRDRTAEIVNSCAARNPIVRLVENPGNRGKGYSVRNGMLHARGQILLFSDADLSSPIEESEKLFRSLDDGADVAIGSRWVHAELQTQRQPLYRQLFGRVFNLLLRITLGLKFKDTQCGFKAFNRKAAELLFPRQRIDRWGFDPELLFLAKRFGLKVSEVPVAWAHSPGTRISPLTDGMKMFVEMLRIRWYGITGKYK